MKSSFVFFMIFIYSCSSQQIKSNNNKTNYIPYYIGVYKADSLYIENEYEKCFEILEKLFIEYIPLNQDYFYEMETYINVSFKLNRKKNIHNILKKLIINWGYNYDYLDDKIKMRNGFGIEQINDFESAYKKKIDLNLRKSIIGMNNLDQKYRKKSNKYFNNKIDSLKKLNEIDRQHYLKIRDVLENNFVDKTVVGNWSLKNNTSIHTLLIHFAKIDVDDKLLDIVLKHVKLGKLRPIDFASMVDRKQLNNGKSQKYDVFNSNIRSHKKNTLINKERKSIGLYPINYMKWRKNKLYKH